MIFQKLKNKIKGEKQMAESKGLDVLLKELDIDISKLNDDPNKNKVNVDDEFKLDDIPEEQLHRRI